MKRWYLAWICILSCMMASTSFADEGRTMTVKRLMNGASFFNITVNDGGLLKGTFPGWCADWAKLIEDDVVYNATYYSSYSSELPAGLIDKEENLDEVNWLLNKKMVGTNSPGGHGVYTSGDVQIAIWALLNNYYETSTAGPFSQLRVDELKDMALSQGSDFYPNCRQFVGMLLVPTHPGTGNKVQTTIIKYPRWRFPKCLIPDSGK